MRRFLVLVSAILAGLLVAGCGNSGNSADPPAAGLNLVPGDGRVTVNWAMDPSVQYFLWYGTDSGLSASNLNVGTVVMNVSSPWAVTGLLNGTTYYFMANGRTNNGPGGPMTPLVSAKPRLAGAVTTGLPAPWIAGAALGGGANDLRGVTVGAVFVAVGAGGVIYSSPDGITWTKLTSGAVANLNAAVYRGGVYLAAGDAGTMLYSIDAISWTPRATGTANKLNAVATNGTLVVAVGANGTIVSSSDGITWTAAASSGTLSDLYAVAYTPSGRWIAVGAGGILVNSTDGSTWTAVASNTALDLKGVAYGAGLYVAMGANGTLVTSADALTWTARPAIGVNTLSAVTFGTQFVAVGDSGSIFTSADGMTWTAQPSATAGNLYAIVHSAYSYSVVGAAGVNLLAQ